MTRRGWLLFVSLGVLWGMPYLLIRIAVETVDPLVVAGSRTLIGALLLLPVALHRNALGAAFRNWKWLLAFTLIEISLPWVLLGHAETRLTSSTAGILIAVVPLFAAIIVSRLGHERLEPRRMLGLGVGFAGVALLVGLDIHFSDFLAVAATIVVSLCYAIGPIIIDRKLKDVPAIGVITASLILATLIYAAVRALPAAQGLRRRSGDFDRGPGRAVHGRGIPGVLRIDRRGGPGARHGDHVREPGRRHGAGSHRALRAADHRDGRRIPAGADRLVPGHDAHAARGHAGASGLEIAVPVVSLHVRGREAPGAAADRPGFRPRTPLDPRRCARSA